jgi:diguanylate cyclase (GGDEF)-like protein
MLKNDKKRLSSLELLNERLNLTLAFSKRYQMSAAICYLRLHLPNELSNKQNLEIEGTLLEKITNRLKRSVREIDTVIRIEKLDFVLLIADITEHDCKLICERIVNSIADTYTIDFHHVIVKSNMGICMYPYGAEESQELQDIAKSQMYEAEAIGENQVSFFNGELINHAYRKVLIENDLPYALKRNQLYVNYQPQFSLKQREIRGVESLIRWRHPSLGEVSPSEFIPYAEEVGILNSLFFWVFEEVCKDISSGENRNIKYSINLSVNQLLLDQFLPEISIILKRYTVSATQLTFEITENIEIYYLQKVEEKLHSLKQLGFTIALDDFGNGYFSISDFLELPVDYIKLDRDFVSSLMKNQKHRSVITPIIEIAHNLGLQIIIEGIESYKQFVEWEILQCDIIQGYFISRPISFKQLVNTIDEIEERVCNNTN